MEMWSRLDNLRIITREGEAWIIILFFHRIRLDKCNYIIWTMKEKQLLCSFLIARRNFSDITNEKNRYYNINNSEI